MKSRILLLFTFLTCAFLQGCSPPPADTVVNTPDLQVAYAAVAMPEDHAAMVSAEILGAGGNAVDAAVAAGFVLAVTLPEAGNIGGGGFMLIRMDDASTFLDYRETAPLAADRDMYLDADGNVSGRDSLVGIRAVGVPGTVAGLWAAHKRYGTLPWSDLVAPAVRLADEGFIVPGALIEGYAFVADWYKGETNFVDHFGKMRAGEIFRQPELAGTLRRIAESGPEDFYRGKTAELLLAQMQHDGGLITGQDLATYKAVWREPLKATWRDYEIVSAPPPSSGGFAVIQLLKMKDTLEPLFAGLEHNSAQYVHLVAEMEKRVFADRAEYLGDPDFVDVRIDELISDAYTTKRALEVNPDAISALEASLPGLESPDTTHYSIVDRWGNAVANTYTLNWGFGSGVVVEGAGFLLNNEMDDFSAKPGVANIFGVVGSTANEIQPGKRMLSSMAPTLLIRDGKIAMVVGTPGGSTIFTSVFQCIVNVLDFGMTPQQAADATRFHHQLLPPDLITYSPSRPLADSVISTLGDRGYRVEPHGWEYGDLQVIELTEGMPTAGADTRGRGRAQIVAIPQETAH